MAPTQAPPARAPSKRGFTLIELLVVISIIALLIGILLPALGKARAVSHSTVCLSNIRQYGIAANAYANDFKDRLWKAGEWARVTGPEGQWLPGHFYDYVNNAHEVGACPTNKRRGKTGDDFGKNIWGGSTKLDFDYTMLGPMEGARLGVETRVAYLTDPSKWSLNADPPPTIDENTVPLTPFRGLPIFVEESTFWYNEQYTDGNWSNQDQITRRHFNGGSVVFFQGHAENVVPGFGPHEQFREVQDMEADDVYAFGPKGWVRIELYNVGDKKKYRWGWINAPEIK